MLLVAGQAVEAFRHDDVDLAPAQSCEQRLVARAEDRVAADHAVRLDPDQDPALLHAGLAITDLILDGSWALQIGRVPRVDGDS